MWDAVTGELLDEPVPDIFEAKRQLPNGRLMIPQGNRILLVDSRLPPEELARRRRITRPDPERHAKFAVEHKADPFAHAMQLSLEQRARGALATEALDFDKAQGHFLAAALLQPKPYQWPEVAPAPRPVK